MLAIKIIAILLGLVFTCFGYFIYFRKKYFLINDFEVEYKAGTRTEDYARRVGMTEFVFGIACLLLGSALIFTGCSAKGDSKIESGDITKENLPAVCEVLEAAGLKNVDVFSDWVQTYLDGDAEDAEASGFADADCRMTVMLLAGDSISADSVEENYDGTYLMFDVNTIETMDAYSVLREKEKIFTTLFGEMPIPAGNFGDAFPENLKKHGIAFNGEGYSVISIVFKAFEEDNAFVGHTGILVDSRDLPSVDADYLFVEKIAFYDAYVITLLKDEGELLELLSARPDYSVEEGEPKPLVYMNSELIGELG